MGEDEDAKRLAMELVLAFERGRDRGPIRQVGASSGEIDDFERRVGLDLPDDLRDWLGFRNGTYLGEGGTWGVRPGIVHLDIESALDALRGQVEWGIEQLRHSRASHDHLMSLLPVASDGCGSSYVIDVDGTCGIPGAVLFLDHETFAKDWPDYVVASGMWHFVRFMLERDRDIDLETFDHPWPFDEAWVLRRDPKLSACRHELLPWITNAASGG